MENVRLDITSSAFLGTGGAQNLAECQTAARAAGFELGIQVHNSAPEHAMAEMAAFGVPLSAHAPVVGDYYLNLAAESFDDAARALRDHAAYLRRFGITDAVFHGFMMSDLPVPNFGRGVSYRQAMEKIFRPELSYDGRGMLNCDFTATAEFRLRRERVKARLARFADYCPEVTWYIENDFPAYGSGNMLAADAAYLEHAICLDACHLWATAHLFDLDFHTEVERFLASGRVGMIHLHASPYDDSVPKLQWSDGHLPLRQPNRMDLPRLVRAARRAGVRFWVLEVVAATADDVRRFAEMWNEGA